jgi:hypothetical protein
MKPTCDAIDGSGKEGNNEHRHPWGMPFSYVHEGDRTIRSWTWNLLSDMKLCKIVDNSPFNCQLLRVWGILYCQAVSRVFSVSKKTSARWCLVKCLVSSVWSLRLPSIGVFWPNVKGIGNMSYPAVRHETCSTPKEGFLPFCPLWQGCGDLLVGWLYLSHTHPSSVHNLTPPSPMFAPCNVQLSVWHISGCIHVGAMINGKSNDTGKVAKFELWFLLWNVYIEDVISATLFDHPKTKATRKMHFIFFALFAGEVTSVFTVFGCENMDIE